MKIEINRTALVITDPQNDFLSPEGVTWGVVGESVTENNTVDNIETLFRIAKEAGLPEGDGYQAAMINFRYMANTVWTTAEAVNAIRESGSAMKTAA